MLLNQLLGHHLGQSIHHIVVIGLLSIGLTSGVGGSAELIYTASASSAEDTEGESEGIPGNTAGGGTRLTSPSIWLP